jgi:hypothetical protein
VCRVYEEQNEHSHCIRFGEAQFSSGVVAFLNTPQNPHSYKMAPLPGNLLKTLTTLFKRTPTPTPTSALSPKAVLLAARAQNLVARSVDPAVGVTPPQNIPNNAIFALFGLIGVGIVLTGIWFFFWAKNGGFYFTENDWSDYKSTVLRRKGPNGTTLSGATASTDLGGGSVVHGEKNGSRWGGRTIRGKGKKGQKRYKDFEDEESTIGGSAAGSELSYLKPESVATGKESKPKKEKKRDKKEKKARSVATTDLASRLDEEESVVAPEVKDAIRAYRHEKPARVGGLNKQPDGSAFDGSMTAESDLLSNRERTPTSTPTKIKKERKDNYTGGIRKVVSTSTSSPAAKDTFWTRTRSDSAASPAQKSHIQAEALRLQEKGRAASSHASSAAGRRDFSFQHGDDLSSVISPSESASAVGATEEERRLRRERRKSRSPEKKVPGSYGEGSEVSASSGKSEDTGTKAYHHPIPGLSVSGNGSEYAEERRRERRGGYRRE